MKTKDYVSRGHVVAAVRRKALNYKKRNSTKFCKPIWVLVTTLLVMFMIGIYCIMQKKRNAIPFLLKPSSHIVNVLPPTPKERWRYIKELENTHMNINTLSIATTSDEVHAKTQLLSPQSKILQNTNKNPQQSIIESNDRPYQDSVQDTEYNKHEYQQQVVLPRQRPNNRVIGVPMQSPIQTKTEVKQGSLKHITQTGSKQKWILQCGSFRDIYQAESIRARLALDGIESHITTRDGWNRVILNLYSRRKDVDKIIAYLHNISSLTCITRTVRG